MTGIGGDPIAPAPGADDREAARTSPALPWEVWRQDDNGVRLRVDRFATRAAAEARIAAFEAHHHKQTYWIERGGEGNG